MRHAKKSQEIFREDLRMKMWRINSINLRFTVTDFIKHEKIKHIINMQEIL
jgi:hypothetical protein